MSVHDIVVLGASAGGVDALRRLVRGLSPSYRGSLLVVLHLSPHVPSELASVLAKAGPLPTIEVRESHSLQPGTIYVPTPNHHLVLEDGLVRSVICAKENLHRPSVDVLFRSAAKAHGSRVV